MSWPKDLGWLRAPHECTPRLKSVLSLQDDEVVLQCVACIQKENRKFCLAAEGLGNRLCYLEPTSEAKVGTQTPVYLASDCPASQSCQCLPSIHFQLLVQSRLLFCFTLVGSAGVSIFTIIS